MPEGPKFKTGDLVQLKSGGPVMTVKERDSWGYKCQWFAGKKLDIGSFPEDSLIVPAEDEERPK